jgi:hypothetical protein
LLLVLLSIGQSWGIHLHGTPFLFIAWSLDGDLWFGESHFLVWWWSCLLLGGLFTCACLDEHPLVALLMDVEYIISLSWFDICAYLGCGWWF